MDKRYKLLKDLPNAKAGEIFERLTDDGALYYAESSDLLYSGEEIAEFGILDRGKGWFEKIEEQKYGGRVREEGDACWYIDEEGNIIEDCWMPTELQLIIYEAGNIFWTKEEAEKELKRRRAYVVLKEDTNGFVPNWKDVNATKYGVFYDWYYLTFAVYEMWNRQKGHSIYFATEKDAEASIKAHRQQWLDFLGIEEKNESN